MFLGEMENKQGFKPFAADNSDNCFPEAPEFWGSTTFHSPLKKINTQATSPPIASLGSWRQPPPGRGISRAAAPAFVVVTSTLTAYHEDKPQCSLQTVDVPLLWSTGASGRKRKTGNQWATHMAKPSPNKHDYFGDLRSLTHPQIENYLMCYPSGPCPDVGKPCVFELKVLSLNFQPWLLNLTRTIAGHIMKFISAVANHDCQTQLISSSSLSAWSLEKSPTIPTQTTPTIRVSNFFGARNPGSLISRWISPWVVEKNHWSGPVRQRRLHHFLLKTWPQVFLPKDLIVLQSSVRAQTEVVLLRVGHTTTLASEARLIQLIHVSWHQTSISWGYHGPIRSFRKDIYWEHDSYDEIHED